MLTTVTAGPFTVRGVSVGGVYTSLQVPELGLIFDAGASPRSFGGTDLLLLSHGHADHVGALPALLGIRALHGKTKPPRVFMPAEIVGDLLAALEALSKLQRFPLAIEAIGMSPGDEVALTGDLRVRAVRTFHPVPSLGYLVVRRVGRLRPELAGLPGPELAARRRAGEDITIFEERLELGYATDTLVSVLDHSPELLRCRVLIMECTFLDDRKSLEAARAGCHVHLDELVERAGAFANEHVVLMHFSQLYRPDEVARILDARVPPELRERIIPFVPTTAQRGRADAGPELSASVASSEHRELADRGRGRDDGRGQTAIATLRIEPECERGGRGDRERRDAGLAERDHGDRRGREAERRGQPCRCRRRDERARRAVIADRIAERLQEHRGPAADQRARDEDGEPALRRHRRQRRDAQRGHEHERDDRARRHSDRPGPSWPCQWSMRSARPRSTSAADAIVNIASPSSAPTVGGRPAPLASAATAHATTPIGRPSATTQPGERESSPLISTGQRHGVE